MDTNETYYLTYSPEDIWEAMQEAYIAAGGDVLYPGDEKEMLLRAVLAIVTQAFAGMDNALRMQTLRYAVRDYLDLLGESRGCERIGLAKARATVRIWNDVGTPFHGTLPTGTPLTADGENFYILTHPATLSPSVNETSIVIEAVKAGAAGNALTAGTIMYLEQTMPTALKIQVTVGASGGTDKEDDETYRERIRTTAFVNTFNGSKMAYEAQVESVPDVVDAKALKVTEDNRPVVDIRYIADDDVLYPITVQLAIENKLAGNTPLTDLVTVHEAVTVTYTLAITCEYEDSVTSDAIQNAVDQYKAWQNYEIGRAFNPGKLYSLLYQAGVTRITGATGSIDDEPFEDQPVYTPIEENERLTGTITITRAE